MIREFQEQDLLSLDFKDKSEENLDRFLRLLSYSKVYVLEVDGKIVWVSFFVERYDCYETGGMPMNCIDKYKRQAMVYGRELLKRYSKEKDIVTYSDNVKSLENWHKKIGFTKECMFKEKNVWKIKKGVL